jgi:hypothetical protein
LLNGDVRIREFPFQPDCGQAFQADMGQRVGFVLSGLFLDLHLPLWAAEKEFLFKSDLLGDEKW